MGGVKSYEEVWAGLATRFKLTDVIVVYDQVLGRADVRGKNDIPQGVSYRNIPPIDVFSFEIISSEMIYWRINSQIWKWRIFIF